MMPDTDVLTQLDFHTVTCQCEQHACTSTGGCTNTATEQIEFHAIDHCNALETVDGDTLNPFGNYVFILCHTCLQTLAHVVAEHVEHLNSWGRKTCLTCGAPVCELADVIREVKTL